MKHITLTEAIRYKVLLVFDKITIFQINMPRTRQGAQSAPDTDDELGSSSQPSRFWTLEEVEMIILWLEDDENLRRTQRGSGETKTHWIKDIATTLNGRTVKQVLDKFDNLKKSFREACKINDQSGWGLTQDDLQTGTTSQRGKFLQ